MAVDEQLQTNESQATAVAPKKSLEQAELLELDNENIKIRINIFPTSDEKHQVTHTLRMPTFAELEARERMMPLIISDAGKVDGAEASSMSLDDEPANVRLYDKIAVAVNGYALAAGEKPSEDDVDVSTVINVKGEDKTVKDLIPPSHKSAVINGLYPASYEVDFGGEEFYFALGGGREWKVRQEIGGKFKREDGTLSPADYTVYYIFREPTQEERRKFRSQAISALTLRTTSGSKDRRSTNLKVVSELFDSLIETIEGATINGTSIDVRDKKSLSLIPATFKKGCIIRLMNFLEADLSD